MKNFLLPSWAKKMFNKNPEFARITMHAPVWLRLSRCWTWQFSFWQSELKSRLSQFGFLMVTHTFTCLWLSYSIIFHGLVKFQCTSATRAYIAYPGDGFSYTAWRSISLQYFLIQPGIFFENATILWHQSKHSESDLCQGITVKLKVFSRLFLHVGRVHTKQACR